MIDLADYSTEGLLVMRNKMKAESAESGDITAMPTEALLNLRQQKQIETKFKVDFNELERYGFGTKEQIQQQATEAAQELEQTAEGITKSKGKIGLIENIKRKGDAPGRHGFDTTVVPGLEEAEIVRYAVIADKVKKDTASFEERQQLTGYLNFLQEEADRGKTIPAQIYDVVSQIPKFGVEFLLTGGAYTGVKKGTEKLIGKMIKNQIVKSGVGAMAGTAARTALMPHRVAGYAAKESLFEGEENIAKAVAKGFGDTYIENLSEVSGEAIGKIGGKIAGKMLNLVPAESAIGKALRAIPETELMKRISSGLETLKTIGYHGTVEEILEERFGDVLRAATGLGKWEDVIPSGEQAIVEAGAFAVPGVVNIALAGIPSAKIETLKQELAAGKETFSRKDVKELFGIERSTAEERQTKFEEVRTAIETPAVEQAEAEPIVEAPAEQTQPEPVKAVPESITGQIEVLKAEGQQLIEESKTPEGIKNSEAIADRLDKVDVQIQKLESLKEKMVGNNPAYIADKAGIKLHNKNDKTQSIYQLLGVEQQYLAGKEGKDVSEVLTENSTELEKQAYNSGIANRPKTEIDVTRQIPEKVEKPVVPVKSKGIKSKENIPAREVATAGAEQSAPVNILEKEYRAKPVEELVKLKKELYPNPDIESPMSPEEKLLNKVIADKFSDKNAEIAQRRKSKGTLPKAVDSATMPSMAEEPAARDNIAPQNTAEAWQKSDLVTSPNISETMVKAEKQADGKYKLFFRGTQNEVFKGEKFNSSNEAREFFKAQKLKAQSSFNPPAPEEGGKTSKGTKKPAEKVEKNIPKEEAKPVKSMGLKPKKVAENVTEKRIFDKAKADAYRKELFSGKQLFSGLDPEVLGKLVYIGGYHLENVGRSFAKWSKAMVDDLGERIKPHLDRIWAELSKPKAQTEKTAKTGDKKTDSVVAKQLAADLKQQDIEVDLNYTPMKIDETVQAATKLAATQKSKSRQIGYGAENDTGINTNAIRLANFYQAKNEGDWTEAEKAAARVISANITAGQDIVVNKGFITDNSPMKFIKKLATAKMEQAGKKIGVGKEGSGVKKVTEHIRQEATKIKEKMTLKQMKIQDAQDFIESLRCK